MVPCAKFATSQAREAGLSLFPSCLVLDLGSSFRQRRDQRSPLVGECLAMQLQFTKVRPGVAAIGNGRQQRGWYYLGGCSFCSSLLPLSLSISIAHFFFFFLFSFLYSFFNHSLLLAFSWFFVCQRGSRKSESSFPSTNGLMACAGGGQARIEATPHPKLHVRNWQHRDKKGGGRS